MKESSIPITVAEGDGIGPEIMQAVLHILKESGAPLEYHTVEIGEKVYLRGLPAGIEPETWETIRNTKAFLKAPITTPQGGGFKSLNVTIRTTLGLYANVRPCVAHAPFIKTKHPGMDVVVIRENEEDLYVGIEYQQTPDTVHALKIISRPGCERIIRYAFDYAVANKREKVTCFTKDNILKLSDGLFHKVFQEVAKDYPQIENEHWIIDIGAAKLADTPTAFDVVVMPNLYGDILSDIGAQIAGSVGLAGSANIGPTNAMFEAIHGSAPRRAGQNMANPSGLLLGAIMMLVHVGLPEEAARIHNAWLCTIEEGIHTYDIFKEGVSKEKVGTKEFAQAVAARLGKLPHTLKAVEYSEPPEHKHHQPVATTGNKEIMGVDVFIEANGSVDALQEKLNALQTDLKLTLIGNRGVAVWPQRMPETSCGDSWRCRFMHSQAKTPVTHKQIAGLMTALAEAGIDFNQTEQLCTFDGRSAYTLSKEEQ